MQKKLLIFLILILCVGCKNYQSVDYKKPYLTIDEDYFGKSKIEMHDYDTKEVVDVNDYGIKEAYSGYYDKYTNNYLITAGRVCELLIVHRNSSSELHDLCQENNIGAGIMEDIKINKEYIIVAHNIGFVEGKDGYIFGIGIYNHDFKLIDYIEKNYHIRGVNIFDDTLYFNYSNNVGPDDNEPSYTSQYNLKTKKEIVVKDSIPRRLFHFKNNNGVYSSELNANCDIYLNDKKLKNNGNVDQYCYNDSVFTYKDKSGKTIVPLSSGLKNENYFLEISDKEPENVSIITDNVCSVFTWYTPQGKYCKDIGYKNIYFNDFVNGPKKLDIDVNSGHIFPFYDWK